MQFSSLSEIEKSLREFTDRADSRIEGAVDAMLQGAALLAEGINPATQERLWDLENIKYKPSYLVTQIYRESYEIGTEEFPVLLRETAISIAEEAELLSPDRIEKINSDFRKLTEAKFTQIDTWIEI